MRKIALLLLGAVMLPLAVGCSQSIVRGQSPDVVYTHGNPGGDPSMGGANGFCPPDANGQCPPGYQMQGQCPPGGNCFGNGIGSGLASCLANGFGNGGPQTNYWAPNDLAYPPANALPGVVQYPYYTLKGPDCFFRK